MAKKILLSHYLADNSLSDSIEMAKREIISGWVKVDGEKIRDPLKKISGKEEIVIIPPQGKFVSRGGEKLSYALKEFNLTPGNKIAVDLGSSTGGFTDCLLKAGAKKVYSVDVGYGQLDYQLRNDNRVVVMERTNVRNLSINNFNEKIEFVTIDLSFVSIIKVAPGIVELFNNADGVLLLKPQFEANEEEHIKGVVIEKNIHKIILLRVIKSIMDIGINVKELTYSPIKGPAGNIEFLLYFIINKNDRLDNGDNINNIVETIVEDAHRKLK